jgi:hypothetical protein
MERINSLAQERQWISGHHMHNLLKKIKNALCDLGASVNLMPKAMFEELGYPTIYQTTMTVQLAESSIKYPEGTVENLLVNVRGSCLCGFCGP